MGDFEALIAQSPSAAAFGDKGYKLILIGMLLNWSRSVLYVIVSLVTLYFYGPHAVSVIASIFKRFH